uniref:Uncharacterized protein n=1 Tax=Oryza nivara TaxID=4536 RepID=A0A0E0J2Y5_ORYNI
MGWWRGGDLGLTGDAAAGTLATDARDLGGAAGGPKFPKFLRRSSYRRRRRTSWQWTQWCRVRASLSCEDRPDIARTFAALQLHARRAEITTLFGHAWSVLLIIADEQQRNVRRRPGLVHAIFFAGCMIDGRCIETGASRLYYDSSRKRLRPAPEAARGREGEDEEDDKCL